MIFIISVVIYVSLLLGVGVYQSGKIKSQEDFMVAGRKAGMWMLVGSLICTWIGSGSLFGTAGLAFKTGFSELWFSSGAWLGILFIFTIAYKVRKVSQYTLTDILEKRYCRMAKILGTATIIIAYLVITGYQFKGGGRLLSIITNNAITPETGTLLTFIFITLFTLLAGMISIMTIDVINGVIMIIAIFSSLFLAVSSQGGVASIIDKIGAHSPAHLDVMGGHSPLWVLGLILPTLLLLLSESSMYQKFSSAKEPKTARKAVLGMLGGVIFIEVAMAFLAIVGYSIYMNDPRFFTATGAVSPKSEEVILRIAFEQVPLWAGLLLINAGVAIIISTGNTFLMVTSTNTTRDLIIPLFYKNKKNINQVKLQRIVITALGVMAYLLVTQFETILEMAFIAYTMIGASLTPVLLAAFFWKRATPKAAVASIIAGMSTTLIITIINKICQINQYEFSFLSIPFPLSTDYIAIPALTASLFFLFLFTYLTNPKNNPNLNYEL